jgi:putative transposase
MPRRSRAGTVGFVFHVINRAVEGLTLCSNATEYRAFLAVLAATQRRIPMHVLAFAVMPNHWHLVLQPPAPEALAAFMKWLTGTHAQQWRASMGTRGRGAVYQSRYKAIAVQNDGHFVQLCRYVERNPLRARLVSRAESWPWSSAAAHPDSGERPALSPWPTPRPADWLDRLNAPEPKAALNAIRDSIRFGRHFGTPSWRQSTAAALAWRGGLRRPGRPWEARPDHGADGPPDAVDFRSVMVGRLCR